MALAGLATLVPAMAQDISGMQRLRARAVNSSIRNGNPTDIFILSANGPAIQFVETKESQAPMQQMASAFKTLYIFETDDFVDAKVDMENRKYQDARNKFAALVTKYASTLPIKDSLSARAAVNELECAMRMMDWAGVKGLLAKFPIRANTLSQSDQDDLEVARIMATIPDKNWNDLKTKASAFLATKKSATRLQQARMKYALGAAALATDKAPEALDAFADAVVLLHGSDDNLGSAAILHSLDAYLRLPDVVQFMANPVVATVLETRKSKPDAVLADSMMRERPLNVREGAALYQINSLMFPDKKLPEKYDVFAISYKNPSSGTPAQAPTAQGDKKPEAAQPATEVPKA